MCSTVTSRGKSLPRCVRGALLADVLNTGKEVMASVFEFEWNADIIPRLLRLVRNVWLDSLLVAERRKGNVRCEHCVDVHCMRKGEPTSTVKVKEHTFADEEVEENDVERGRRYEVLVMR